MANESPRFLADAMLIRLARWLRLLDYDTLCLPEESDAELVAVANREQRYLLTRDRALVRELRPELPLYIHSQHPMVQLDEVDSALGLKIPGQLFRRCLLCNTTLHSGVLPYATEPPPSPGPYWHCPNCRKTYWSGLHTRRMRSALAAHWPGRFQLDKSSGRNMNER